LTPTRFRFPVARQRARLEIALAGVRRRILEALDHAACARAGPRRGGLPDRLRVGKVLASRAAADGHSGQGLADRVLVLLEKVHHAHPCALARPNVPEEEAGLGVDQLLSCESPAYAADSSE
jgi:hypothetical protein